jgi:hypothetical protein
MLSICVAMLSLAVGVASASATAPEAVAESGGIAATTFEGIGGAGKLETTSGNLVTCIGNKSSGTISSATMINGIVVKFNGCKTTIGSFIRAPCKSSGAKTEEIVTNSLTGELSYLLPNSSRVALDIKPTAVGGDFVTFTCALGGLSSTLTVKGSVIGELKPVNAAFGTSFTLDLEQIGGMQRFTTTLNPSGCAPVTDVLSTEATGLVSFPLTE